ncbi:MAG: hypothetical protein NC127_09855 [Muribaculum sp.]|nr:hypothetical protein [Muribaculum sp.]
MNVIEAIKTRKSIRNYSGSALPGELKKQIEEYIAGATSPFGGGVTIRLEHFESNGPMKPGTYGVIKGATDFLLIAIAEGIESELSAGFMGEQIVIRATELGLGTCWIGGTFKGGDFDRGQRWPAGEFLKIVSPIGFPAEKESMISKITRFMAKSGKRKPFGKLFFESSFDTPMRLDSVNTFLHPLSMMRLAPSSINSQPWRALVSGEEVHFFSKAKGGLSMIDCGIGLCHFDMAERYDGHTGEFYKSDNPPVSPAKWTYLTSYRRRM